MKIPKNILIIKYGALGDVIRTSFFAKPIRLEKGGDQPVRLYWLTSPSSAPLIRFNPYIDVVSTNARELEAVEFDTVFSLDDEVEILQQLGRFKARQIVGAFLTSEGAAQYCEASSPWFDMGLLSRFGKTRADELKVANEKTHSEIFKGIFGTSSVDFTCYNSPEVQLTVARGMSAQSEGAVAIGLNAFAGKRWPSKAMPNAEVVKLVDALTRLEVGGRPTHLFLIGSGTDYERNLEFARSAVRASRVSVLNTDGNILDLVAAVGQLRLLVTTDSLCLHLSTGQRVPSVSFFAPTSAAELENLPEMRKLRSLSDDYCCYKPDADNSTITAERVMQLIGEFVELGVFHA